LQLQDQVRDQLNDHLEAFLARLQGEIASEVEIRLLPGFGALSTEVVSLRGDTAETGSLTGALRDDVVALESDVVELTRMLRMQADAADQVAEALGRTLIRLSVEVEDLNVALGASPGRGTEAWPPLGPEVGPGPEVTPAGDDSARPEVRPTEREATTPTAQTREPSRRSRPARTGERAKTGPPASKKQSSHTSPRGGGETGGGSGAGDGAAANGSAVPVTDEAPSSE
jgi:hypothetical protein